jgi:hypothetical protein
MVASSQHVMADRQARWKQSDTPPPITSSPSLGPGLPPSPATDRTSDPGGPQSVVITSPTDLSLPLDPPPGPTVIIILPPQGSDDGSPSVQTPNDAVICVVLYCGGAHLGSSDGPAALWGSGGKIPCELMVYCHDRRRR